MGLKHLVGNLDKTKIAVTMKIRKKVMTLRMEQEEAVGTQHRRVVNKKVGLKHLVGNLDKTKIAVTMKIRKKDDSEDGTGRGCRNTTPTSCQ